MNAINKSIALVLVLTVLISCKDDELTTTGYVSVNGDSRPLTKGFFQRGGQSITNEGALFYQWRVMLVSDGLEKQEDYFSGTGDSFTLRIFAYNLNSKELPAGRYEGRIEPFDPPWDNFLFSTVLLLDYSYENGGGGSAFGSVENGKVVITKVGEHYMIKFNTVMEFGEVVEGEFIGVLQPL